MSVNCDTIGIIGQGFVGTAVRNGLQRHFNIETFDKYKNDLSTCSNIADLASAAKIIFVCLPTPMREDGSCDLSIVESAVLQLDQYADDHIAVIKSTIIR